jgi:hypothetical protein
LVVAVVVMVPVEVEEVVVAPPMRKKLYWHLEHILLRLVVVETVVVEAELPAFLIQMDRILYQQLVVMGVDIM